MKRIFTFLASMAVAFSAFAQTADEIVTRMDQEMSKHHAEGLIMTVSTKIPLLGTMDMRTWTLGDKSRGEATMMGETIVTYSDGTTSWTYDTKSNKIEIKNETPGEKSNDDSELFQGITEGYSVSIKKEYADAWLIECKKLKENKDKDAPKTMEIVVAKETFYLNSLKASMSGLTIKLKDIEFGVTEEDVTFNPDKYPGATIEDKR